MDAARFDTLTRALTAASSRRGALATLLGGTLGLLGLAETTAKNKKGKRNRKGKKKKNNGRNTGGSPTGQPPGDPALPPPFDPTCIDGSKNGSETDVDCGGGCGPCATGQRCTTGNDCASAYCSGGTCQACPGGNCGSDANGNCSCHQPAAGGPTVCTKNEEETTISSCAQCPANTVCAVASQAGRFDCYLPCGAP